MTKMATTMTMMLMIYDRKRTAYRAAKCPRQSITYQPTQSRPPSPKITTNAGTKCSQSCILYVQSPTVTQNDNKLGIPRNFLGFFKITKDSEEYHTQATKDVLFCKHVNTDIYSSSFLTQTPVYPL